MHNRLLKDFLKQVNKKKDRGWPVIFRHFSKTGLFYSGPGAEIWLSDLVDKGWSGKFGWGWLAKPASGLSLGLGLWLNLSLCMKLDSSWGRGWAEAGADFLKQVNKKKAVPEFINPLLGGLLGGGVGFFY